MPETPNNAYNPPTWRVWLPHVATLTGGVVGIPVILAFGPKVFAGYLAGLFVLVIVVDRLLDRRWPIPADDDLEEFLAASHAAAPDEFPDP